MSKRTYDYQLLNNQFDDLGAIQIIFAMTVNYSNKK